MESAGPSGAHPSSRLEKQKCDSAQVGASARPMRGALRVPRPLGMFPKFPKFPKCRRLGARKEATMKKQARRARGTGGLRRGRNNIYIARYTGADGAAILAELGYGAGEIATLLEMPR